jgi:hypothetical protein
MTDFSAKYPPVAGGGGGGSGTVTEVSTGTGLTGGPITLDGTISLVVPVVIANGGTNSTAALSNNRIMRSTGGAIVEAAAITASRALASDANGIPVASATTATELGYVSGVTSSIQTQLNAKEPTLNPGDISTTTAGVTVGGGTNSTVGPNVTVDVQTANGSQPGLLSAADWTTFNGKQGSGNYITALTGNVTASGPGSVAATIASIGAQAVSGTTGTTNVVFSNSPTLVTPALGTPSAVVLTNGTGLPLTTGITGTLGIGNGGTGQTTAQAAIDALAGATTDNRVLQGNGTNIVLGQIDDPAFFTTGAAASNSAIGIVTTAAQSFAGVKTFYDGVVLDDAAGQTTLAYYREDGGASAALSGGAGTGATVAWTATRVGRVVTLTFKITVGTSPGSTDATAAALIPSWARPAAAESFSAPAVADFTNKLYIVASVSTGGNLTLTYRDITTGSRAAWSGTATSGSPAFITYAV